MSSWGMNDGAALTGKSKFTNGAATFIDGTSGPNTTYLTDKLQVGDAVIGADGLVYRITAVASETAATLDRDYEGDTVAAHAATLRCKLPRWLKITNDDGTGKSLQDLGVFGITNAERSAGVDNLGGVGMKLAGSCHRSVPAVTCAAPPTNTIAQADISVADNTFTIANHGFRTGTKLNYLNGTGSSITGLSEAAYYVIAKETTDSGSTFGDLTNNTFAVGSSLANAQAGTAVALSGTGNATQTFIGDTATATATLTVGKVSKIAIASVGSAYTSAPTITIAAPATETIDASDATKCVIADDEFVVASAFYGCIATGDPVTYADGGGTAVVGLTDATGYYLIKSGTSNRVGLATTKNRAIAGTAIDMTAVGVGSSHTLIGQTPTATATLGMGTPQATVGASEVTHIGWVKKTIGTGGRAGRVFYETLVAASSITGDAEDLATPDS